MRLITIIILILTWTVTAIAADLPTGNQFYVDNLVYLDAALPLWAIDTPANQQISSSQLTTAANILGSDRNARAFLVARNGRLVFERYFNGANAQQARNIHSASKSILSMTVGAAITDNRLTLDTTLLAALGQKFAVPKSKQAITVKHLLTMTSGIAWTEDSTEYQSSIGRNRIQGILNLSQRSAPGIRFNYSTGDATLLAAVLAEQTGRSYAAYAQDRLLGPLGITVERWGIDPQGYYSGGCNFFITPREMLRFGQGVLESADVTWVKASTTPKATSYYGYMWWTDIGDGGYRAWGWGQQFIYVWPAKQLLCVTASDTASRVRDGDNLSTINRYVFSAAK